MKKVKVSLLLALFLTAGQAVAQSLFEDAKTLTRLLKDSKNKYSGKDLWFKVAESKPFVFSEEGLIEPEPMPFVSELEASYVVLNQGEYPDQLIVYKESPEQTLVSVPIKHEYCILQIKSQGPGRKDELTMIAPSGEILNTFYDYFIDEDIYISNLVPGNLLVYAGELDAFKPRQFQFNRFALEEEGTYSFPAFQDNALAMFLKSGADTLASIGTAAEPDQLLFTFFSDSIYQYMPLDTAFGYDSVMIEGRQINAEAGMFQVSKEFGTVILTLPDGSIVQLFEYGNQANINLELAAKQDSTSFSRKRAINDFKKPISLNKRGICGLYDQIIIGKGAEMIESVQLLKPFQLKKIAYSEKSRTINLSIETNIHKRDVNYLDHRKKYTQKFNGEAKLKIITSVVRRLDYTCPYISYNVNQRGRVNGALHFDVYELGDACDTISVSSLSRAELTEKVLQENVNYKIVLNLDSLKESISDLDYTDFSLNVGTDRLGNAANWYPAIDPVLEVIIQDSTAILICTPTVIDEHHRYSLQKTDTLSLLLGSHSQIRHQDNEVADLWGEISDRYKQNPILGETLRPHLAQNRFEQLPGIANDSLSKRITKRLDTYYGWHNALFENNKVELTGKQVSVVDLAATYRSRIPSATDKLQVASEQFSSESKKLRRGLSTAEIAAGLSDFIVERAQEELNITFLNRLREGMISDNAEFSILFPNTVKMMGEFKVVQYRTLLDFAKSAFVLDLKGLSVNFPKLFSKLPKYERINNDPKVYNIFLIYDIANKVYEGMPIDTVLLHIHGRLYERRENLLEKINQQLGVGLEYDAEGRSKLTGLITRYKEALEDFDVKSNNLESSYGQLNAELLMDMVMPGKFKEFVTEEHVSKMQSLQVFFDNQLMPAKFDFVKGNIDGDPGYAYLLDELPFEKYQEFFGKEPKVSETISVGIAQSENLLSRANIQEYIDKTDHMEKGAVSLQALRGELELQKANISLSWNNYLPTLKRFKELMIKKASLEWALKSETHYLPPGAVHVYNSLAFLHRVLLHPEKNNLYDWSTLDHFRDTLVQLYAVDSFLVANTALGESVVSKASKAFTSCDELKILAVLANQTERINREIDLATAFLDKMAGTIKQQFEKIRGFRLNYSPISDSLLYSHFLFSEQLTDGSILLDYEGLDAKIASVLAAIKEGNTDSLNVYAAVTDMEAALRYNTLRNENLAQVSEPTENQFLDCYDRFIPFNATVSTTQILTKELSETRNAIAELDKIASEYTQTLDMLRYRHAKELMPSLLQAEQFDSLTSYTLLLLDAFKNGATVVDSIVVKDTTVIHVRSMKDAKMELSFDSLQINYRKLASGPGARRWITPQQFNQIMEDTLSKKAFLGLLYQRLKSVKPGANTYDEPNMTLLVSKMMNTIYEIDDARAMLRYKKGTNELLGFEDYYPFIRTTVDLLNIVLETPIKSNGRALIDRYHMLQDVPEVSIESLSLFENIFAENYSSAIRNVVKLLSITWGLEESGNTQAKGGKGKKKFEAGTIQQMELNRLSAIPKKDRSNQDKKALKMLKKEQIALTEDNKKVKSAILVYGSFMANMVGAQTPQQVKSAIRAVAVPPGNSSVKRNSRLNIDINSYLGVGFSMEKLNVTDIPEKQTFGGAFGLSVPIGLTVSLGQRGRKLQSYSFFFPVFDLGAITTWRINQPGLRSELPELQLGNLISPGCYFLWNIQKSPFTIGAGAQFGPQLRKITVNGTEQTASAWHIGVTFAIDVPIFNIYTKQDKRM